MDSKVDDAEPKVHGSAESAVAAGWPADKLAAHIAALNPKDAGAARLEAMRRLCKNQFPCASLKHRPQMSDGG